MLYFLLAFVLVIITYRLALEQGIKIGKDNTKLSLYIKYMVNKTGFEKDMGEFHKTLLEKKNE